MTAREADHPVQKQATQLRVDRYVLDLGRGCLIVDGSEIALRPKTFAVLSYLIENCGRLVSKDELFGAVWPDLAVTDDTLVQSVGELRRALADDGPRLIKTVPRRGYRFEADVSVLHTPDTPLTDPMADAARSDDKPGLPKWLEPKVSTATTWSWTAWLASLTLVILVAAVVLWAGSGTDRNFLTFFDHAGRSATGPRDFASKPSVAILPFRNQGYEPGREHFADGLTQDIINALGRFSGLTVMSWNAILPYRDKPASPDDVARSLAVRYQVEGSVHQTGDRIRVDAQLVDAGGRVLWSSRFDEALADLFALQDKITTQIAEVLAVRLTQVELRRVFAKPTDSFEAYDHVVRARPALLRPSRANNVEARALLRHAIQVDPNYAAAYAALGETYHIAASMGWAELPSELLGRAETFASKAVSIDDFDVRGHVILGRIHLFYHRYTQAQAEMDRALAINPNDADGLAGRGNALMWLGQTDQAIDVLEEALHIDPDIDAIDRFALSLAYYLKRRYEPAIEQAELNLRGTVGANFSRVVLAAAYAQNNQPEDAARTVATIRRFDPTFDPQEFGTKFLKPVDLENLRDGLRKAGIGLDATNPTPNH